MKAGEWLYLCVAHGIDSAFEVCFVHITASTGPYFLFFPWEALLHYRLYFTYRRQHDCLVKLATHISFKVWHGPPSSILKHYITYTFFPFKLQTPVAFHRHSSLARRLGRILAHTTSAIVKHLNKLKPDSLFSAFFHLVRAIRTSPSWIFGLTDGWP